MELRYTVHALAVQSPFQARISYKYCRPRIWSKKYESLRNSVIDIRGVDIYKESLTMICDPQTMHCNVPICFRAGKCDSYFSTLPHRSMLRINVALVQSATRYQGRDRIEWVHVCDNQGIGTVVPRLSPDNISWLALRG